MRPGRRRHHGRRVHLTPTQTVHQLTEREAELVLQADGTRSSEELVAAVARDEREASVLRASLLRFVRHGLLVVPHPSPVVLA